MRRRTLLSRLAPAILAAPLAPWMRGASAAAAARGEAVVWPSVALLDGTPWPAEQVRGQAVVVVFWRLDCPYCERHNAHLDKLYRAAAGKPLTVLGVVVRERDARAVRQHMARRGWQFPVTLDAAPLSAVLSERRSVPLTVSVDRQGRLREVIPGEMFEDDMLGFLKLAD